MGKFFSNLFLNVLAILFSVGGTILTADVFKNIDSEVTAYLFNNPGCPKPGGIGFFIPTEECRQSEIYLAILLIGIFLAYLFIFQRLKRHFQANSR